MAGNRQFVLASPPQGQLKESDFALVEGEIPVPGAGEVLVLTRHVSIDAANRAWMQGATYRPAVSGGQVMAGGGIGEVVASNAPGIEPGDWVYGETGWQEFAVLPGAGVLKLAPRPEMTNWLSVYGIAGLTAYLGLTECGAPKPGETVLVSAAAGAVGSLVGQVAKALGCRTIGVAGGAAKCALLTGEFGFDAAVDYKAEAPLRRALREAAPNGVDIYFDNVAGEVLEAALFNMAENGRIVCCGAVSAYDGAAPAHGPRGVPGLIVTRRLTMRGFIAFDLYHHRAEALARLEAWVADGTIRVREDVISGFQNLPRALIGLLAGDNVGKRIVSF